MARIETKYLQKIRRWYVGGLSVREVAERLKVTIHAMFYFMRYHKVPRRNHSAQNVAWFARKPLSFALKSKLSPKECELKVVGTILYWGEGHKAPGASGIDFTNSDPHMIVNFVLFLRRICGVTESRLRILLYCYSNQKPSKLIAYWSNLLNVPKVQFSKPYVRDDFRIDKISKMPYGLVHVRYADKKLLDLLRQWIEEIKNKYASVVP